LASLRGVLQSLSKVCPQYGSTHGSHSPESLFDTEAAEWALPSAGVRVRMQGPPVFSIPVIKNQSIHLILNNVLKAG
jgi:hypothetical protein